MIAVQMDFQDRSAEVTRYFEFLKEFEQERVSFLEYPGTNTPKLTIVDQAALYKTLKANGFLLLYNLVESTVKNAIEAIFDEFRARSVSFDHCLENVRNIVLANLKKRNVDDILPQLSSISVDIVSASFRKDELFSGNVDGRQIREVADKYGIRRPGGKSDNLLTVKTNRNYLAHGNKSFADVGRDFDIARLDEIKVEVQVFLGELLTNVADYITNRSYLAPSPPA
jgi:hypothetical protein